MRQVQLREPGAISLTLRKIGQPSGRRLVVTICLLAGSVAIVAAVRAFNYSTPTAVRVSRPRAPLTSAAQQGSPRSARYFNRLGLQPAADRMRRTIGRRFLESGREISESAGTLTIGTERHAVVIVRTRDDDGERVSIGLDGGPLRYSWNGNDGAQSQGTNATGNERSLIERIALDSPDQFVLAQLRGAAYYTAVRGVRPAEAGGSEDYTGPIWDVIQVSEPASSRNKPESASRLYYINNATGLIDRTTSREHSGAIEAAFSDWVSQNGEMFPLRTTWSLKRQVIMEMSLSATVTRPRN